jgi:hypothetical protein
VVFGTKMLAFCTIFVQNARNAKMAFGTFCTKCQKCQNGIWYIWMAFGTMAFGTIFVPNTTIDLNRSWHFAQF